jgi:Glycerophosphoryl diester phosphodiesterase family
MKIVTLVFFNCFSMAYVWTQVPFYSSLNGHSHNDYTQKKPFNTAFKSRMGSIEADVYLIGDTLYVAHERTEVKPTHTLESLYLKPLAKAVKKGKCYPLQLMIDIKTGGDSTLKAIMRQITPYTSIFKGKKPVLFVISGNRPKPENWLSYPSFIQFDGRPNETYTPEQWQKVGLVSDNFMRYTNEEHKEISHETVFQKMKMMIEASHLRGKKVRFWATSDDPSVWRTLMAMGVDFINTDAPKNLKKFIGKARKNRI